MSSVIVHIRADGRGRWHVARPGSTARVTCATLDDARRIAFLWGARARSCELVVRDARGRLVEHDRYVTARNGGPRVHEAR